MVTRWTKESRNYFLFSKKQSREWFANIPAPGGRCFVGLRQHWLRCSSQMDVGRSSSEDEAVEREFNHSPQTCVDIKKSWTPTSVLSWCAQEQTFLSHFYLQAVAIQ
jgi:hypothetical protein